MAERKTHIGSVLAGIGVCVVAALLLWFVVLQQERNGRPMRNSANVRAIVRGMAIYGQDHDGRYPGREKCPGKGDAYSLAVQRRYQCLLENDYISSEVLIHPQETDTKTRWHNQQANGLVTADHYSYAMLQVPESGGRRDEWRLTMNSQAAVVSDRNLGSPAKPQSVWDKTEWEGAVGWNDGHVSNEQNPTMQTRYGKTTHKQDHWFRANGPDDARMIYTGN